MSHDLSRLLTAERVSDSDAACIVGVEHEYYLHRGCTPADFRRLIDDLSIDGRRIDPGDHRAYRLRSGHMITCDDAEAECAISPIDLRPGFAGAADRACRAAAGELRRALPPDIAVTGASTHLSVACPDRLGPRLAAMIVAHFAPSLMLLTDDAASFGLLVRPRFGRIELGGDYVSGPHLRAALAMAAGAVVTCLAVIEGRLPGPVLPPRLVVAAVPARERYGSYVSRRAFPPDLYGHGRATELRLADGESMSAGDHLELAWKSARSSLAEFASPDDLVDCDDFVAGVRPLPVESSRPLDLLASSPQHPTPFGRALELVERPNFRATAVVVTWELVVFVLDGRRRAFAAVTREDLDGFTTALRAGHLDATIGDLLTGPDRGRVVPGYPTAVRASAFYDHLGAKRSLATPERTREGRLALVDGTVLSQATLPAPSAPGVWALSARPDPGSTNLARPSTAEAESAATGARVAALGTSLRWGKFPIVPSVSVEEGEPPGSVEEAEPVGGFGEIGRWWIAILIATVILVIVGFLFFWPGGDDSAVDVGTGPTPTTAVEGTPIPTTAVEVAPTPTTPVEVEPTPTTAVEPEPSAEPAQGALTFDGFLDWRIGCSADVEPTDVGYDRATDLDTVQITELGDGNITVSVTVRQDLEAYFASNPYSISVQIVLLRPDGVVVIAFHELHEGQLTTDVVDDHFVPIEGATIDMALSGARLTLDLEGVGDVEGGQLLVFVYSQPSAAAEFVCDDLDEAPIPIEVGSG